MPKTIPTPDQPRLVSYEPDLHGNTFLTDADFCAASKQVWGSERYGMVAAAILERVRPSGPIDISECEANAHRGPRTFINGEGMQRNFDGSLLCEWLGAATQDLVIAGWDVWLDRYIPFGFEITTDKDVPDMVTARGARVRVRLETMPVVRALLKRYLEHTGYTHHELHGTFGMALDVMNMVAYGKYEIGKSNTKEPTVRRSAISRALVDAQVSSHYRSQIGYQIQDGLLYQLRDGKPPEGQPEIRVYGGVRTSADGYRWNYDSIALDSLKIVTNQLPAHSPAVPVLRQITDS